MSESGQGSPVGGYPTPPNQKASRAHARKADKKRWIIASQEPIDKITAKLMVFKFKGIYPATEEMLFRVTEFAPEDTVIIIDREAVNTIEWLAAKDGRFIQ